MIKISRASRLNTTYMHVSTISYVCEVQSDVSLVSLCCPQIVTAFVDAVYRSSGSTTHEFEAGVHVTVPSHSIDLDVYLLLLLLLLREDEMKKKKKKTYVMPYSSTNLKANGLLDPEALIETL